MTSEPDTLAQLVAYHDHIAVPPFTVADDVRRGRRRVRRNRGLVTAGVALAVVGAAVVATTFDGSRLVDRPLPLAPMPSAATPSPSPPWERIRPASEEASMPVLNMDPHAMPENAAEEDHVWNDTADTAFSGVDIEKVRRPSYRRLEWHLELRGSPPPAATLDPERQVVEYGLVVDGDGDLVADCQIGISSNASTAGDYRVWVTNLRTGVSENRIGPPYGVPFDFTHPDEAASEDPPPQIPTMKFYFLYESPTPCDQFGESANFYAWASMTDNGRVTRDFAPNAAWLAMPQ
jgi:hypothetical protein